MHLGWSSRTYPLDAVDVAALQDFPGDGLDGSLPDDEVVMLVGGGLPDRLVRGRKAVDRAAAAGGTVSVRIAFLPSIAKWNLPFTLVKALRSRRRFHSTGVYHIATEAVRQMGLERAVRTLRAPQKRKGTDRSGVMSQLEKSLRENGYDDAKPIDIMLCRTRGCEDSLRQGHHRISACISCGVPKMAVRFSAAGALPRCLGKIAAKPPFRPDVFKNSLESSLGRPIAKLVPLEDGGGRKWYIAVPEDGGRFVVKLSSDERDARRMAKYARRIGADAVPGHEDKSRPVALGGRYVFGLGYSKGKSLASPLAFSSGVAQFLLVPALVAGALVLDVALMKKASGARSVVALGQFALIAASAGLFAILAAMERRCRAGYLFAASIACAIALDELFRDVEGAVVVGGGAVSLLAAGIAIAVALAIPVFSKRSFHPGLRALVASRGFLAMPIGVACIFLFSKLVSARFVWERFVSGGVQDAMRMAKEGTELLGYATVFCWAVMFFFERLAVWRRRRQ